MGVPPTVRGCMLTESVLPNRVMNLEKGLSSILSINHKHQN